MIAQVARSDEEACLVDVDSIAPDRMIAEEEIGTRAEVATAWADPDGEMEQAVLLVDLAKLYKVEASRATKTSIRFLVEVVESSTIKGAASELVDGAGYGRKITGDFPFAFQKLRTRAHGNTVVYGFIRDF